MSDIAIPGELKKALAARPAAAAAFERLPPSHKAEYVRWITEAKGQDTRVRRANMAVAKLTGGA
jgi:uncharacterized protein YdeI (YjbR/CyaY-like superfamily)